jgi:hypothetical protein
MNENENLVTEVTENVEDVTTEETSGQVEQIATPEKVYTEAEFNEKLNEVSGKRASRKEAKIRKEYDRNYGELIDVLKAGTGIEGGVREITKQLRDFYSQNGVEFPSEPNYTAKDIEILANAEANEIIKSGFEDVIEEADRLKDLGFENMNAKEKAVFVALTEHIKATETSQELAKIGVTEDVYNSPEFKEFSAQFTSDVPISKVYEIYTKTQPKKEYKDIGSIKHTTANDTGLKDFYSKEEAEKFTKADFDNNPALYKRVCESMTKW